MTKPKIGDTVTVKTDRGTIHGRVIGTETRTCTGHGSQPPRDYVCLSPPSQATAWFPVEAIAEIEPREPRESLTRLLEQHGKAQLLKTLGRMA